MWTAIEFSFMAVATADLNSDSTYSISFNMCFFSMFNLWESFKTIMAHLKQNVKPEWLLRKPYASSCVECSSVKNTRFQSITNVSIMDLTSTFVNILSISRLCFNRFIKCIMPVMMSRAKKGEMERNFPKEHRRWCILKSRIEEENTTIQQYSCTNVLVFLYCKLNLTYKMLNRILSDYWIMNGRPSWPASLKILYVGNPLKQFCHAGETASWRVTLSAIERLEYGMQYMNSNPLIFIKYVFRFVLL